MKIIRKSCLMVVLHLTCGVMHKTVFVIAVELSPVQSVLYKRFLDVHGLTQEKASIEKSNKSFSASYQASIGSGTDRVKTMHSFREKLHAHKMQSEYLKTVAAKQNHTTQIQRFA
ncbi:uncharacterized protein [Rutidosis leptorrhynchoides]|uniref:uncharacterized protein n=1 Tax=Rutidosis leptorrhynchoides TaxID=125765 RepID=UPI003A9A0DD6